MSARGSREFEGLLVAADHWPIILMEFPERRIADASVHGALKLIEELMVEAKRAGEKTYQITDLTRMQELAPASQRKYASEWMGRTLPLQRAASLGGANVSSSAIVRGLITAINWLQDVPMPTVWVATRREACDLALEMFERAGIPLQPDVRAWLTAAPETQRRGGRG